MSENPKENFLASKGADKLPVFIATDNRLISFKQQILPFWTDICKKSTAPGGEGVFKELYEEFKKLAEEQLLHSQHIPVVDHVNHFNGGIQSVSQMLDKVSEKQRTAQRLDENLRIIKLKFDGMATDDSLEQRLAFVDKLGYTTLQMMHDEMLFKLEKLLSEMLLNKQKQSALSNMGLSTQNKKTAKKKLQKKLKKLKEEAQREND